MTDRNFEVGKKYFSFEKLKESLSKLFDDYSFEILASRKRIQKSRTEFPV
jgi:hypothetical protein